MLRKFSCEIVDASLRLMLTKHQNDGNILAQHGTELCVVRTFGGVDFSLTFICAQSVPEFLWDRLRASIQFPVMPKRAQYARFSGEYCRSLTTTGGFWVVSGFCFTAVLVKITPNYSV